MDINQANAMRDAWDEEYQVMYAMLLSIGSTHEDAARDARKWADIAMGTTDAEDVN